MHTLRIILLIQFLVSSTCSEHHVSNIRKTIVYVVFLLHVFHAFVKAVQ